VLAAFVVVALGLSAPSLAQDVASSAVAVTTVPAEPAANFSLLGLFLSADWIVKIVMIGLLAASIWCWAIIIDKSMLYGRANRQMNQFERVFWSGQSLEDLYQQMQERPSMGLGAIFVAAMNTVWGIMNSFTSIAASKSTNLAVVAPGIAEALFATALGLLAAIPATIAYNKLSADSNKLIGRLESFADEFATILSRQLEARGH